MDVATYLNGGLNAKWYKVPGASGVEIEIQNIKPSRRRAILRTCTKQRMRRGTLVTETDDELLSRLLLEECITNWRGIEHAGDDFPCTPENKRLLDDNWPEFNVLWNAVLGTLTALDEAMTEAELGNLQTGQISS